MKLLHRLHNPSQSDNCSTWVVEHKTHPKTPTHTHTHTHTHKHNNIVSRLRAVCGHKKTSDRCNIIAADEQDSWGSPTHTYIHTYLERRGGGAIRVDDIDWTATFGSRCALELRRRRLHWVGNQYCAFLLLLLLLPQITFFRRQLLHGRRRKSEFGPVFFTVALSCRSSTSSWNPFHLCGNHR